MKTSAALPVLTLLLFANSANALDTVRDVLSGYAKSTSRILEAKEVYSVTIGQFHGPPRFKTATGPGIARMLEEEFAALGLQVSDDAPVTIQGRFFLADDSLQFSTELTDRNGRPLSDVNGRSANGIRGSNSQVTFLAGKSSLTTPTTRKTIGDIATVLGATVNLQAERHSAHTTRNILASFDKSTASLTGRGSVHSQKSPFYLQIVSNSDNMTRPAYLDDGVPYVDLENGETFHLHFWNYSDNEVSARFYLDGINSFAFSEVKNEGGRTKYKRWIVPAGEMLCLKGWHKNDQYVDEFKVVPYSESGAARLGQTSDVGTISVSVQRTWIDRIAAAPSMKSAAKVLPGNTGRRAIGFGQRREMPVIPDMKVRRYGETEAVITIRYQKP